MTNTCSPIFSIKYNNPTVASDLHWPDVEPPIRTLQLFSVDHQQNAHMSDNNPPGLNLDLNIFTVSHKNACRNKASTNSSCAHNSHKGFGIETSRNQCYE